jgi:hypothetical protein
MDDAKLLGNHIYMICKSIHFKLYIFDLESRKKYDVADSVIKGFNMLFR